MKRLIAWFVGNPIAANLLMAFLVVGGLISIFTLNQEVFPSFERERVAIKVEHPGATPGEVEKGICIRIEEAIDGIEGIRKFTSRATENLCTVHATLFDDADDSQVQSEIESAVDAIKSFPADIERPVVSKGRTVENVISLALSGHVDEYTLKEVGKRVRDELVALPAVSLVDLKYTRPYEISVEVSEDTLRRYGLTLSQVAQVIRAASLDLPGGTIRTRGSEMLIRTEAQAYYAADLEEVVVHTRTDGSRVLLRDVADIVDGFRDTATQAYFNGEPAIMVEVNRVGGQDLGTIAAAVKKYAATRQTQLPDGVRLTLWKDNSELMDERFRLLRATGFGGLVLVLLALMLFLRFRLALKVTWGILVAVLGAMAILPFLGISLNTLSITGYILVLGIVVDDAIVVGERIYSHEREVQDVAEAVVEGTFEVSLPVIFGVLTTIVAFLPMLFATGVMSVILGQIGIIVCVSLVFSLIESQLILPVHIAHRKRTPVTNRLALRWLDIQTRFANELVYFSWNVYQPLLLKALEWRYAVAASALAVLFLTLAMVASGRLLFQFFPAVEGDRIYASLELPAGVSEAVSLQAAAQVERAAGQLRKELDGKRSADAPSMVKNVLVSVGSTVQRRAGPQAAQQSQSHLIDVVVELAPASQRDNLSAQSIANRWRELTGPIPGAVAVNYSSSIIKFGEAIDMEFRGDNLDELRQVAAEVRKRLAGYPGVFDLADSFRVGKEEIRLELLPEAENLGLTRKELAQQVRQAFYGEEAQRVQRGQDEVKVMVRYPAAERRSISNLEEMRIRTADGTEVPFTSVARYQVERGPVAIKRVDRTRVVNITADVDRSVVSPEEVLADVTENVIPELLARHPGVQYRLAGEMEEQVESMGGVVRVGIMALLVMYALLAIPLRSYAQPLLIMSVIPFGAIGAIAGHILLGWDLVFFSLLGMVALSGVVVNASLVMIDYINRRRAEGVELAEAVIISGTVRFRPIILTAVTTFVGIVPLILIDSAYTSFFVPMAISLAFGILFATLITLLLVPVLYTMLEDFIQWRAERTMVYVPTDSAPRDVR